MQFITNQNTFLTPHLNQSFALRRNVRIKSSKLPPDFFVVPHSQRYLPSPIISRQIGLDISNRQPRTPSFQCRKNESKYTKDTIDDQRKAQTARLSYQKLDDQDQLISGILSTPSKLRKVVRKHSLGMKQNQSLSLEDRHLRLPQILNKATHKF